MATTTAPTAAEIETLVRRAFQQRADKSVDSINTLEHAFVDIVRGAATPLLDSDMASIRGGWLDGYYPAADHPGTIWAQLSREEVDELYNRVTAAARRIQRQAREAAVQALVEIGLAFAEAHPDVPRAVPMPAIAGQVIAFRVKPRPVDVAPA